MSHFDPKKIAKAMTAVRMATSQAEVEEWTAKLVALLTDAQEFATGYETRLHALNLATALHKDTYRLRLGKFADKDKEDPDPDITGEVIASAERFSVWLTGDGPTDDA